MYSSIILKSIHWLIVFQLILQPVFSSNGHHQGLPLRRDNGVSENGQADISFWSRFTLLLKKVTTSVGHTPFPVKNALANSTAPRRIGRLNTPGKAVEFFPAPPLGDLPSQPFQGSTWVLNGSANLTSVPGAISVTQTVNNQHGSAWREEQVDLSANFDKFYALNLGTKDSNGADGLVFVLQNVGATALGGTGYCIGYCGITPSVGVELDTWQNGGEPAADHLAVNENGSVAHNGHAAVPLANNIEDGQEHLLRIRWDSVAKSLSVFLDGQLKLTYTKDIAGTIFGGDSTVWLGFTGGTGSANNLTYFYEEEVEYSFSSSLTPTEATLSLGGQAVYTLKVRNLGRLPDSYTFSQTGLDPNWVSFNQSEVSLAPGEAADITMIVEPTGCPTATTHNFTVTVHAENGDNDQVLSGNLVLNVEPIITLEAPGQNITSGSTSILFRWRTDPATTGELTLYPTGHPELSQTYPVSQESTHTVQVDGLTRNTGYEWFVDATSSCGSRESSVRSFTVGNGLVFQNHNLSFTLDRDYDQRFSLTVTNEDTQSHALTATIENPYADLIVNFVGSGSIDETISLAPGQSHSLSLAVHAQDTTATSYEITARLTADEGTSAPITDYTAIHLTVLAEGNFTVVEDTSAYDPLTLARTYVVTNNGKTITDLSVSAIEPTSGMPAEVIVQPTVNHARMGTDEQLRFVVYPIFGESTGTSISTQIDVRGSGNSQSTQATLQCPAGKNLYQVTVNDALWTARNVDWYCTNRPSINPGFKTLPNLLRDGLRKILLQMIYNSGTNVKPHSAQISFNGEPIGGFSDLVPNGTFSYEVPISAWQEGLAGPVAQTVQVATQHTNGGHYVVSTEYRLQAEIDHATFYVCATSQQEANALVWDAYDLEQGPQGDPHSSVPDDSSHEPGEKPGTDPGDDRECSLGLEGTQGTAGDPINTRTGALDYSVVDLSFPTSAGPLAFQRYYASNATERFTTTLGYGWTHNHDTRLIFSSDPGGMEGYVLFKAHSGNEYYFKDLGGGLYSPLPGVCGTLVRNPGPPVEYVLETSSNTTYTFGEDGRLLSWTDPQGHGFAYSYDASGRLERIEADGGLRYLAIAYDAQSRVQVVSDHTERSILFTYNANGDLATYTDPATQVWTYTYDPAHRLTRVDAPGQPAVLRTEYDSQGRAYRQYNGAGELILELTYHPDGSTTVLDGRSNPSLHTYDDRNTLVETADSLSAATHKTYDGNFRPQTITDPLAHTTTLTWSPDGSNLTQVEDALGHVTEMGYDSLNNLTSVTDARLHSTTYVYEGTLLVSATDALEKTTTYTYTTAADAPQPPGLLKTVTDPRGNTTTYTYDAFGQRIAVTSPLIGTTQYAYDDLGRLKTTTDPLGRKNWTCYDPSGRVVRMVENASGNGGTPQTDPCDADDYLLSTLPDQDRIHTIVYDVAGNPIAAINPSGSITRTYYDGASRAVTVVQNLAGQGIEVALPPDRNPLTPDQNPRTDTVYDEAGNVLATIDPEGQVTRTYYDAANRPVTVVRNLAGQAIELATPPARNPSVPDENLRTDTVYDEVGNVIATIDPAGVITRLYYDELNRVTAVVQNLTGQGIEIATPPVRNPSAPDENVRTDTVYDAVGNPIATIDPLGVVTRTYFDATNRPVTVVQNLMGQGIEGDTPPARNPSVSDENLRTDTVYDEAGNAIATIDALGVITRTYFDAANRPVTVVHNLVGQAIETATPPARNPAVPDQNLRTDTVYDEGGRPIAAIDPAGVITRTYYDALHRPVTVVQNLTGQGIEVSTPPERNPSTPDENVRTDTVYDATGAAIATVDPAGVITRVYYDLLHRPVTTVRNLVGQTVQAPNPPARDPATPDENVRTDSLFALAGNRTDQIDPNGVVTHFGYDFAGRLVSVTENYRPGFNPGVDVNVLTEYTYDLQGNRLSITDGNAHTSTFAYDALGRLQSEADPLSHTTAYTYTLTGQPLSKTDANGATTLYGYDAVGRLETIDYPDPDADVTFTYNAAGQRLSMGDGIGATAWAYDEVGRVEAVTDPFAGVVGYAYDLAGNRTGLTYPDARSVTYQYDPLRRLEQVTAWDTTVTQYAYDPAGRPVETTLPNGVTSNYSYDDLGRLESLTHATATEALSAFHYTYDPVGNRRQATESLALPPAWAGMPGEDALALLPRLGVEMGGKFHAPVHAFATRPRVNKQATTADFARLPLAFIVNQGQSDRAVRFQVQSLGGSIYFTDGEVTLALPNPVAVEAASEVEEARWVLDALPATIVRQHFVQASPDVAVVGAEPLPGVAHFLTGNGPAAWHTDVPTYRGVLYQGLYPGIDLKYEGVQGLLKSSYLVAPGADPSLIQWRYDGPGKVTLDDSGDLVLDLPGPLESSDGRTVVEHAPLAWQEVDGTRVEVAVSYQVSQNGEVGFALPEGYDTALPLVIDPTLTYSTYLGGTGADHGEAIAVDEEGNAYLTGTSFSTAFPTATPIQPNQPAADAFISKLNATGDALLFSTYIGGGLGDYGEGIALDSLGRIVIVGSTSSSNFPIVNGYDASFGGGTCGDHTCTDAFALQLNAAGNAIAYSTFLGGAREDEGMAVGVGPGDRIDLTGSTTSPDFPTRNAFDASYGGGTCDGAPCPDGIVARLDPALSGAASLVYASYFGDSSREAGQGLAVDGSGQVYITGYTQSSAFPTLNPYQASKNGIRDAFVVQFDPTLTGAGSFVYGTFFGGAGDDRGAELALGTAGQVYLTGFTESSDFPLANAFDATFGGGTCGPRSCRDAFAAKLNISTNTLAYSTYLGGGSDDEGNGIVVDAQGQAYLTGSTRSSDFPVAEALQASKGGESCATPPCGDAFVVKLALSGSALVYSTYLGGDGVDYGTGIAIDEAHDVYVVGATYSADFPALPGSFDPSLNGTEKDVFVVKIYAPEPVLIQEQTIAYSYDPLSRLTEANYDDGGYFHYSYDAVGNRLSETTEAGTTAYTYDLANRLTSVNGVSYTWDANGNLLADETSTYTYDHANRLTEVGTGTETITYGYNGLGDRLEQIDNGTSTRFTLDITTRLTQVLKDSDIVYLYGINRIAQYTASPHYFLSDYLGSVRQLTDGNGELIRTNRYAPFGEDLEGLGSGTSSYGYAGEWADPGGLIHLRAREYDPANGLFTTRDTWRGAVERPQSLNGWIYTEDNPVNYTDPSGHIAEADAAAAAAIVKELASLYNVHIQQDWGWATASGFPGVPPPISCWWEEGSWYALSEIEMVKSAIIEMVDDPQDLTGNKFRSAMGWVRIVRMNTHLPPMAPPLTNTIYLTDSVFPDPDSGVNYIEQEKYQKYTVIHEFGHIWDYNTNSQLTYGMAYMLGTIVYTPDGKGYYDVWAGKEPPPGEPEKTGKNYAATFPWEDWAESFANYIYPDYFLSFPSYVTLGPLRRQYVETAITSLR